MPKKQNGEAMTVTPHTRVRVLRPITRKEGPYAAAGDEGVVEEVFRGRSQSPQDTRKTVPWYAKVRMSDGSLKTFRLTSITTTGEKP
jgi:hypothetical protein